MLTELPGKHSALLGVALSQASPYDRAALHFKPAFGASLQSLIRSRRPGAHLLSMPPPPDDLANSAMSKPALNLPLDPVTTMALTSFRA